MKWLVRAGIALALLFAALLGLAAWLLPSLAESEQVRARIERAAHDALGRDLAYETLSFGLLPPSLRVVGPRISGPTPKDPALLEARVIALRVALLPLLTRTVLIDSLVVEGGRVHLVRTSEGLVLPEPPAKPTPAQGAGAHAASPADGGATADAGDAAGQGGAAVTLAVRRVELRDTQVTLDDRAVKPAVQWELRDLDATARGRALDAPIALDLRGQLASGGAVGIEGTARTSGALDLAVRLDGVAVAPLRAYLGRDVSQLEGALSGDVKVVGRPPELEQVRVDLDGEALRFAQGDVSLSGPAHVEAELATPGGQPTGTFAIDATGAALGMGGAFTKPPGTAARVSGRIAPAREGGGLAIEDVKLVIRNLDARGRIGSLSPLRVELSTPEAFDLEGWGALVPSLAGSAPSGRIRLDDLAYRAQPQSLAGAVELLDVVARPPNAGPVTLRGTLRASGSAIRGEGLTLESGGEKAALDLALSDLFSAPRYRFGAETKGADTNRILAALLDKPDTVYGPLGLDAKLSGALGDDPLRSLRGRIDFGIADGRLVGVSFLRAVFDQLGGAGAGALALDLGRAFGGRDLQRFYGDEFQLLTGVVDIANGVARTDDLKLEYRGYGVSLRGRLGLEDLSLDMTGALAITPELDAVIADALGVRGHTASARVIPLAAVRGTLGAPKIRVAPETGPALALSYAGGKQAAKLREQVEKGLGPGSGELVDQGLQALEGLFGGGRKAAPAPTPAEGAGGASAPGTASPPDAPSGTPPAPPDVAPATTPPEDSGS